jgi:uncharacterized repeat protein (TIGR04076 family)
MAQTPDGMELFEAEVIAADGPCHAGHQVGDKLTLSCWDTGGLCGYFYHDIFPALSLMQFGGAYPWDTPGQTQVRCCDKNVNLTMVIRKRGA